MIPLLMFLTVFICLLAGYPVAMTLGGVGLAFAAGGILTGAFAASDLGFIPGRLFDIMSNQTLLAVPLFILMSTILTKARIGDELIRSLAGLFGRIPGGMGFSVVIVGLLMAASTGIVGASVVTLGLIALPTMMRQGYHPAIASGIVSASGTLGQIIPPSIVLVLLGDVIGTAYQQAQLASGIFNLKTVSVVHIFLGAIVPGLLLVGLYLLYLIIIAWRRPALTPAGGERPTRSQVRTMTLELSAPLLLIVAVLGSILAGIATPTEAAGVGAIGALVLVISKRRFSLAATGEAGRETLNATAMVFFILIGASIFSLVFRGYGGDEAVRALFQDIPGGKWGALLLTMLVMFGLGFLLDFIEIIFVVVPIVGPALMILGLDPVWLGIMIAINLQTSFLTPPFGFALFYLRGIAPAEISTSSIYLGALPFVALQLALLFVLALWPELATWLPDLWLGGH